MHHNPRNKQKKTLDYKYPDVDRLPELCVLRVNYTLLNYLKCMLAFFIAFINFEVAKKK